MKRRNRPDEDETPESLQQTMAQRISPAGRRMSDEEGSGDLDLNATPLGFDLNAPVEEEEVLQANSEWQIAHQGVERKPDIGLVTRINDLPLEVTSCDQPKAENALLVGHGSSQAVTKLEEVYEPGLEHFDEENAGLSSKEEEGSDQGEALSVKSEEVAELEERPRVTIPAVFCRPFEPLNITTSSDEELDILRSVWSAWQQEDAEALDMTLASSLEELGKHALSPNRYLLLTFMYVSKRLPEAFSLPRVFKVLLSFLESATAQAVVKRQSLLPILACKLLFRAFAGEPDWPIEFVQMYLLDSTGSRAWIDHEGCKEFVSNVLTAFPDSVPDVPTVSEDTINPKSTEQGGTGDLQQVQAVKVEAHGLSAVKSRYLHGEMQQKVRAEFCQSLNQLLGAASSKENPRPLLRLLMQGAGFEEARVVSSSMLEGWLNNPVHLRAAKSLLDRILQHTRGTSENDFNTVANLLALRVSTIQAPGQIKAMHNNIFFEMITHLVRRRPEYATLALKTFVTTELQNRNSHNIKSIITVLKALPSEDNPPEHELAIILQELAASDESHGQLCDLVRRMMQQAGGEFDVHVLCVGLIQAWPLMAEQDEFLKKTWIYKLVDLTCQLLLHAASAFVEDEGLFNTITSVSHLGTVSGTPVPGCGLERSSSGGLSRDKLTMLEKLSLETQNFQMQAMAWCTDVVAVYLPHIGHAHFKKLVRQLLFLEEVEAYFPYLDPAISLKAKSLKLMGACTRAPEEIIARLILMGISNFPMEPVESLDIIQALVFRAAKLEKFMEGSLVASSFQLPAAIFKLASFDLKGVSRQPVPQLVVKELYWQACLVVLIVAVFNPSTIGRFVWESVPVLRSLMEVLVAGGRAFLSRSSEDSQLESDKSEADAEQFDMEAEDVVGKLLADRRSTESRMGDWDDLEGSETEWKGRLMILNHSGPMCRPTRAVYDKLYQLDETYLLGYLLRKCRSPDFFSEVAAIQTLQQAWPWLQSIVSREPEVVTHFPSAWQCELLYMLEGGHPTAQKLSVDLQQLQADLCQVVSTPGNEKEINTIIGFLARKLGGKQFSVRYRARMCLSSLLQTTSKQSNVQASLPLSPRELKRAETAFVLPSRWPVHATDTAVSHHSKKPTVGCSGSSSLHVSPGISLGLAAAAERSRTALQGSGVNDPTAWLISLEALQTTSTLVSVLLPSIQVAIQQETSISVVMAYLDFLKKHAPPLPSRHSMACSLAILIMHRKMFTPSLLSGPPALPTAFSSYILGSKSRFGTMDLILESFCEALETGTVSDLQMDESAPESRMVTLASPQYLGNEQVVRRVSLHKVVVDAALKVLSFLALNYTEGYDKKLVFLRLLNILFPDTQLSVSWLEDRNGEKIPLLTKDQALLFARCNAPKLIRAGLAALSLSQKLDVCEKLGLSSVASIALLEDLDTTTQNRLEAELGPRGSFCQRAKKLQKCVRALIQGYSGIRFSGLLDAYTLFAVREIPQPSKRECVNDMVSSALGCARTLSSEELGAHLVQVLPAGTVLTDYAPDKHQNLTNVSTYVDFRLITQQALLCINDDNERCIVSSVIRCLHLVAIPKFDESWSLIFPNLNILERINNHDLPDFLHTLVSRIQIGVQAQSLKSVKNQIPPRMSEPTFSGSSGEQLVDSLYGLALKNLSQVPVHRLERWLRVVISSNLSVDWRFKVDTYREVSEDGNSKLKNRMFILEMLDLPNIWHPDHGNVQQIAILNERVRSTGLCALICEHLMFIDPELLFTAHLASLFEDKISSNDRTMFSITKLTLDFIIQSSSWQSVARILKAILGVFMNQEGKIFKGENSDINKSTHVNCAHDEVGAVDSYHEKVQRTEVLDEASYILEFILLCIRHPRTVLSCRFNEKLDPLEYTETSLSFVDSESAIALAILAVADLMATNSAPVRPRNDLEEVNYSCKLPLSRDLVDQPVLVSLSRAVKVLLAAASKGKRILSTIIEKLGTIGMGSNADMLYCTSVKPELKGRSMTTITGAAQELMAGLYLAFPVSVRTILQSTKDQEFPVIDLSSFLEVDKFSLGKCWQTYSLYNVLHRALRSICKDGEKEARSAYGFCHDMARQHPSLVVPHLPTLSVLLKEMLPMVKQQDTQGRSSVARTYLLSIDLLDALRPYLLTDKMSCFSMSNRKASLEVILGFYFEFLRCLEVHDRPQFAKVVARLADFLCHCVDAGGYYRDYVLSYRTPVLQSAAHKFGKIKKLGFLLGMLDQPEHAWGNTSAKSLNGADDGKTPVSGSLIGPPSLPLEDVLKVRTQLLHCIRWQGPKKPQDSRLELFHARINPCSAWYEMKGLNVEEFTLAATLSDLERASARMPTILSALEDSLLELTDINDPNVRERAYILLERLLLHCSSEISAANILQRLVQQLSSSDTSLAMTAARQASRFYYYCSEFQETILVEMLQMGRFASDDLSQLLQSLSTLCGGPIK